MAAAAYYRGGGGGKFPKRSSRRAPATPYDRPLAAARGLLRGHHPAAVEPGGSGWLSKLVDPASRIIARSASCLLPFVFRKSLADPPAAPEENHQSRQEVPEVPSTNSSSEVQERYGLGGENPKDNHDAGGTQQEINSDGGGISELEQLLKQKTFTRVEFEHLTELLRSRTIEPCTSQPAVNHENEEKANVSEHGIHNKVSTAEPSTSQPADNHDQKEKTNVPEQEAVASFRLHGSVTTPVSVAIHEETASPAEIAKAYLGSRSSKVSPSTLSLRSQIFQEDAAPYAQKSFDMAIAPRSVVCFSGIAELMENGYATPRPNGRLAIYRMSGSPYFKAHPMTNIRGGRRVDGYSGPSTSSQWISANISHSGSKLALKRGSSVLDSDVRSLGPMHRICQKSNLMSPSRNIHSSLPGNPLPTPSSPLRKGANQRSTALNREPLHLVEPKYSAAELQDAENGYNKIPSASIVPIPPQSSETAGKILQQLDKLVPSPKEKSSELKIINRDETPSKLTQNILHGWALKSMEDIDSSKFLKVQVSDKLDVPSSSHLKSLRSSTSQKQERAGEKTLKPAITGTQVTSEAVGMKKSVIYATDGRRGMRSADFAFSVTGAVPSQKKPSFQMSAPEDSFDLVDDNYYVKDTSGLSSSGDHKYKLISECKKDRPGNSEKSPGSSSKSMPSSTLILDKRSETKASDMPVSEKHDAFLFPSAYPFKTSFQTPSPPMSTSLLERSTPQKEEVAGPTFKFGFKEAQSSTFSSIMTAVSDPASLNFGVSNDVTSTLPDGSNSDKEGNQNAGDVFKSFGNVASSGLSSSTNPALFAFEASATPMPSNGSLSLASLISAAPAMTFSDSPATSVFSTSIVTSTSSGSPTISSAITMCSVVPSFQFGSTGASTTVTPSPNQSDSTGLEGKSVKASSFGISSSITPDSAAALSSTGSNNSASATSSVFSSMGTSSSSSVVQGSRSVFSSMGTSSSSSVVQGSRLFSSTTSGSLALSTSVSTDNGFLVTTASAHSSSEKLSFVNNSSQTLPYAFGATGGSIFNTQATQSGSGVSNFSQSSPSQFDSFASQPVFGLTGSSSSGSANSLFGSATPATKSFGTSSVFSFSTSVSSSSSASSVSFASTSPFATSSGFSFSSGTISSFSSGGSTSFAPAMPFGSGSGFPFSTGAGSSSSSGSSSSFASTAANIFNSSSQSSTSSIFGSTFGSTAPSPSTGFSFGLSSSSSASSPFRFGTSSRPAFSFTSAGTATSTSPSPFGVQNPAVSFISGSPGNDRMNVEDSMADDTNQASAPVVPTFGQQTNLTATPSFMFSSPAAPSGGPSVFQIGGQQNNSIPQNPSPFQTAGNPEFAAGESFSLGSGGGDKSGRKFMRVKRDKHRKK